MTGPDDSLERAALARGLTRIAGVDEVGRGPYAGPVTAAAVVLDLSRIPEGLNDSKKLTARRREALAEAIYDSAEVSIAEASVEEIDRLNILAASHLAMRRAIAGLGTLPDLALIDGNRLPADLPCAGQTVIRGDALSVSIAAASIVAKIGRDARMAALAQQHPGYGWDRNAGYGTKEHQNALLDLGVTPHHRRSFAPIRKILMQGKNLTS